MRLFRLIKQVVLVEAAVVTAVSVALWAMALADSEALVDN